MEGGGESTTPAGAHTCCKTADIHPLCTSWPCHNTNRPASFLGHHPVQHILLRSSPTSFQSAQQRGSSGTTMLPLLGVRYAT